MRSLHGYAYLFLLVLYGSWCSAAPSADSSAYRTARDSIQARCSGPAVVPYLDAAAALAAAGVFGEAAALLRDIPQDICSLPGTPTPGPSRQHTLSWRIAAGLDLFHSEMVDADTLTQEQLDSLDELADHPVEPYTKARLRIGLPAETGITAVTPAISLNSRYQTLSCDTRIVFSKRVMVDAALTAAKRVRRLVTLPRSADSVPQLHDSLVLPVADSTDNLLFSLRSRYTPTGPENQSFLADIALEHTQYRCATGRFASSRLVRISPQWELFPGSPKTTIQAGIDIEWEDFFRSPFERSSFDTLDLFSLSPHTGLRRERDQHTLLVRIDGGWQHALDPRRDWQVFRGNAHVRYQYATARDIDLVVGIRSAVEREEVRFDSSTVYRVPDTTLALTGARVQVKPAAAFSIGSNFTLTPFTGGEYRTAPQHPLPSKNGVDEDDCILSLWETLRAGELGCEGDFHTDRLSCVGSAAYRHESVTGELSDDNRRLHLAASLVATPGEHLSCRLSGDYTYIRYLPKSCGRESMNYAVALGVTWYR